MIDVILVLLVCSIQQTLCGSYRDQLENLKCGCDRVSNLDVSKVKIFYSNYASDGAENWSYIKEASDKILASYFNQNQCVNIFILGFNTNIISSTADDVKCSFAKIRCNNMKTFGIIIDHTAYTTSVVGRDTESYKEAVRFTKSIGEAIGRFCVELLRKVNIQNLRIIGHSLGGQMAGYVGEVVKQSVMSLPVLFATDPAGPCFVDCPNEHVRSGQAQKVISFHCSDTLGTKLRLSDYDFISHDGVTQIGCEEMDEEGSFSCSHSKCVLISLVPSFTPGIWESRKCDSYSDYRNGKCNNSDVTKAGYTLVPDDNVELGKYFFEPKSNLSCAADEKISHLTLIL